MQLSFGSGQAWAFNNTAANPTPRKFSVLQDISLDIDRTLKSLKGTYQFPVAIAAGEAKISGKAKFGQFNVSQWNDLMGGGTLNTGTLLVSPDEQGTIPTTPYQITVAQAATFKDDLGVRYKTSGLFLTRVASGPTTGQYSVNTATGIYTFAAADTTLVVLISYSYTAASGGVNVVLANPVQGTQPTVTLEFYTTFTQPGGSATPIVYKINNAIISKFSLPTKMADFSIMEFDYEAFADLSNNLMTISGAE